MTASEPLTVRAVQDFAAAVDVEFLATFAHDQGWSCICRGRGEVEGRGGVNVPCPVCHGVGSVAA